MIHTHHLGLRQHYAVARASVEVDTAAGWISTGAPHLQFVPSRLVPKNVMAQSKWRLGEDGCAVRVKKWRITTDDSMEAAGVGSRNEAIDRADLGDVSLPTIQQLARAAAIIRATAGEHNVAIPDGAWQQVALWALDLTGAYGRVAAARHEWWMQCFLWHDGVQLDSRCEFGSAHLVDLFQRISSFVMAVARVRIRQYDVVHECGGARRAWRRQGGVEVGDDGRTYADTYLDDGFGLTCTDSKPLRGSAPGEPPVCVEAEPQRGGVRLCLHVGQSRPEVHLAIVRRTFQEAGRDIAVDKGSV